MGPENWPRFAVGQGWGLLLLDTLSAIVASSSDEYGSLLLRGGHFMTSRPKIKTNPLGTIRQVQAFRPMHLSK